MLSLAAHGWEHQSWVGAFYPADLPDEWRLAYFANEFHAVVIPAGRLDAVAAADVDVWRGEVPPGFRFLVELPGADRGWQGIWPHWAALFADLGEHLFGFVCPCGRAQPVPEALLRRPVPGTRLFLDGPGASRIRTLPRDGWRSIESVWRPGGEWDAAHNPRCGWLTLKGDEPPRELAQMAGSFLRVCDESALLVVESELDSAEPLQCLQALLPLMA